MRLSSTRNVVTAGRIKATSRAFWSLVGLSICPYIVVTTIRSNYHRLITNRENPYSRQVQIALKP
jgi:hypothetical protein